MKKIHICLLVFAVVGCRPEAEGYQGYVEGDYVYIAPTTAGILEVLSVQKGQEVEKGEALFSLDKTSLEAARLVAVADVEKATAILEAEAKELARVEALVEAHAVSQAALDNREASHKTAEAVVRSAEQKLAQIEKQLEEASPVAPEAGRIEETFFRVGEFVPSGKPVVSLLPPENVKVRFFVAQAELPLFEVGQSIFLMCDGCVRPIKASVSFIASQSEYTPPVVYSVGSRDKMVFMIEAQPDVYEAKLHPGLPVDVTMDAP